MKIEFEFFDGIILVPTIYIDSTYMAIGFLNMSLSLYWSKE